MDYLWIVWLVLGVVFAVAEVFTLGFVLLWFGVGAFVAGALALVGAPLALQLVAFVFVSLALTAMSRTIFERYFTLKGESEIKTGMASLPGQIGTVVESSRGALGEGAVKVYGSTWTALPAAGEEPLASGDQVSVERVEGAVIYVRRVAPSDRSSWRRE